MGHAVNRARFHHHVSQLDDDRRPQAPPLIPPSRRGILGRAPHPVHRYRNVHAARRGHSALLDISIATYRYICTYLASR
jgi:hypothetical protein